VAERAWQPNLGALHAAREVLVLAGSLWLALVTAGCGGDDEEGKEGNRTPTQGAVATVDVKETDFKLDPAKPRVSRTGVVTFKVTNNGQVEHNLEVEAPSGEEELPENIKPGESATLNVNLDDPGRYEWYCPVANHKELGMKGEIVVAGGEGSKSGESTTPGSDQGPAGGGGY
jgi:plastocyanin